MPTPPRGLLRLPPHATERLLWPAMSTALEALQPLVLVLAYQLGAMHLVRGHNPINFCNGLLFGNLFSLAALLLIKRWRSPVGHGASSSAWTLAAGGRVLLPVCCNALYEVALVIVLSRVAAVQVGVVVSLSSIVLLVGRSLVLRQLPDRGVWAGVGLVVAGSWFLSALESMGMVQPMAPMGLNLLPDTAWANGLLLVLLLVFSSLYLTTSAPLARSMSLVDFGLWQSFLQSIIFLIWATTTYGLSHIYALQSPLLWVVMLVYGAVISTAYTLVEAAALSRSGALMVSLVGSILPLFSAVFGFFLLGQALTAGVLVGAGIVAAGILVVELH